MYRMLIQCAKEYIEMKKGLASRIRESLVATPTRPEDLHDVENTEDTIPSKGANINDNDHEYDTTAVDSDNEAEVLTFREKMDRRVAESDEPDRLEHAADIAEVYKIGNRSDSRASREAQKQVFGKVKYDPTEDLAELTEAQADAQVTNRPDRSTGEAADSFTTEGKRLDDSSGSPEIDGQSTQSDNQSIPQSSRRSPSEHDRRAAVMRVSKRTSDTSTDKATTGGSSSKPTGQNDTVHDATNKSTPPDREGRSGDSNKSNQGDRPADFTDTTEDDGNENNSSFWDK